MNSKSKHENLKVWFYHWVLGLAGLLLGLIIGNWKIIAVGATLLITSGLMLIAIELEGEE